MALVANPHQVAVAERDLQYDAFGLAPLTPHIGAEIRGIDLAKSLTDEQDKQLKRAFHDWMVLVFPEQRLTPEQHKALGLRFGRLHTHPLLRGADIPHPEILPVVTNADSRYTAGDGWHTDVTCDEIPPLGSMLYVTQTPECGGGDTLFADMYLAYDLLSEPMRNFLESLTAVHDGAQTYAGAYGHRAPEEGHPRAEHPMVIRHPETGKKVLFVNRGFTTHIVGLGADESRAILELLFRHIDSTPKLYCRVQWQPNTLTFWDNRCTQHHAIWDYYPQSRRGQRVSILSEDRPRA